MHLASPYVAGHRGRTFVVTLPGDVIMDKAKLYPLLEGARECSSALRGACATRARTHLRTYTRWRTPSLTHSPPDILLLHGLGVRLVIVCGASKQIDAYLKERGREPALVAAYRVTDEVVLQGAIEAAGTTCTEVSALLSRVRGEVGVGGAHQAAAASCSDRCSDCLGAPSNCCPGCHAPPCRPPASRWCGATRAVRGPCTLRLRCKW